MTPAKQEILMQGQSSIAKKIYECVPIQEAWPTFQIAQALKATAGSTADIRRVQACLSDLVESGLIREPQPRHYQRAEVKEKPKTPELKMQTHKPLAQSAVATQSHSPIDILGELSVEILGMAEHLKKLARRVEDAALAIEQERENNSESLEKLNQLKTILKGL